MAYTCTITPVGSGIMLKVDLFLNELIIESSNTTLVTLDYYFSILGEELTIQSFFTKLPVGTACIINYVKRLDNN